MLRRSYRVPATHEQLEENLRVPLRLLLHQDITVLLTPRELVDDCQPAHNRRFLAFQIFVVMVLSERRLAGAETLEGLYAVQRFRDEPPPVPPAAADVPEAACDVLIRFNLHVGLCSVAVDGGRLLVRLAGSTAEPTGPPLQPFDLLDAVLGGGAVRYCNPVSIRPTEIDTVEMVRDGRLIVTCRNVCFQELPGVSQFQLIVPEREKCLRLGDLISGVCTGQN